MRRTAEVLMLRRSAWDVGSRLPLALKAALAAGVAYQVAVFFPSPIDDYSYYAPLGAVLALYPSVASSLRAALQTVLGIVLGATIAVLVDLVPSTTNALTIALVIVLGILAGVTPWLGEQRGWVPITALFVFAIGNLGSWSYVVAYVVLTLVGAAIGTLVNLLVFPPLYLRQSSKAVDALQNIVAVQLEELAGGMERNETPDRENWEHRTHALAPTVSTMRQAVYDMGQSTRGNPRARRHRQVAAQQQRQAQAFRRIALLLEDLVNVLAEVEQSDVPALPFNERARQQCADALHKLADLTTAVARDEQDTEQATAAAYQSLERFATTVSDEPRAGGSDPFVAGSIVTTLRRCLGALATSGGPPAIAANRPRLFQ